MELFYLGLAAFIGGLVAAALGYFEGTGSFDPRKFGTSVLTALIAAVVITVTFNFAGEISYLDLLAAFLSGAGVDVLRNRVSGAISSRNRD